MPPSKPSRVRRRGGSPTDDGARRAPAPSRGATSSEGRAVVAPRKKGRRHSRDDAAPLIAPAQPPPPPPPPPPPQPQQHVPRAAGPYATVAPPLQAAQAPAPATHAPQKSGGGGIMGAISTFASAAFSAMAPAATTSLPPPPPVVRRAMPAHAAAAAAAPIVAPTAHGGAAPQMPPLLPDIAAARAKAARALAAAAKNTRSAAVIARLTAANTVARRQLVEETPDESDLIGEYAALGVQLMATKPTREEAAARAATKAQIAGYRVQLLEFMAANGMTCVLLPPTADADAADGRTAYLRVAPNASTKTIKASHVAAAVWELTAADLDAAAAEAKPKKKGAPPPTLGDIIVAAIVERVKNAVTTRKDQVNVTYAKQRGFVTDNTDNPPPEAPELVAEMAWALASANGAVLDDERRRRATAKLIKAAMATYLRDRPLVDDDGTPVLDARGAPVVRPGLRAFFERRGDPPTQRTRFRDYAPDGSVKSEIVLRLRRVHSLRRARLGMGVLRDLLTATLLPIMWGGRDASSVTLDEVQAAIASDEARAALREHAIAAIERLPPTTDYVVNVHRVPTTEERAAAKAERAAAKARREAAKATAGNEPAAGGTNPYS